MSPGLILLSLRVLIGAALFAFLVFIIITLRRDLRHLPEMQTRVPAARLVLHTESTEARFFRLDEVNLIGRAADNTITLEEDVVSAHHARLSYLSGNQWWLEDLGSRNGTSVNGMPVEQPLAVTDGDRISFGTVECQLVVARTTTSQS